MSDRLRPANPCRIHARAAARKEIAAPLLYLAALIVFVALASAPAALFLLIATEVLP